MQETRLPPKHKGTRGYEGGAEYAQAQHHAKMTIKKGATSHQRPPYDPEHRARQDSMADALNPHRQTSPEMERRRSQRLQKLAEEQAEADAKATEQAAAKAAKKKKKRDGRKRKKTEEEAIKRIEDTDHVDDEDVQFNPSPAAPLSRQNRVRSEPPEWYQDLELPTEPPLAPRDSASLEERAEFFQPLELPPELPLAESRTSSASSSGSSSFESVQEDEDTDQPAKKQRTQSVFT